MVERLDPELLWPAEGDLDSLPVALDVEQAALERDSPLYRMALDQFEQGLEHADVERTWRADCGTRSAP